MPQITLPVFQGPLDLLLRLIERDDLDITAVSLVAVTDQYLAAIHSAEEVDPHLLAEFIAIGAKLIYLKSRALLPRPPVLGDEALDDDDVGRELVDLLVEYRRFSEVTDVLQERQEAGVRVFTRLAAPPPPPEGPGLDGVTLDAMRKIMLTVLSRVQTEAAGAPRQVIPRLRYTLTERLQDFRAQLKRRRSLSFREAIASCRTRVEVIISFLAVLELLKAGECEARQDETWGDIQIVSV